MYTHILYIYIYIYTYIIHTHVFSRRPFLAFPCMFDDVLFYLGEILEVGGGDNHRWNRNPRPQPRTFSKLASLI